MRENSAFMMIVSLTAKVNQGLGINVIKIIKSRWEIDNRTTSRDNDDY